MELPKQNYFLGDKFKIDGQDYIVTTVEFTQRSEKIDIWIRLMGPVSRLEYQDDLDTLLEIDKGERALINGESHV